jgi:hypothetical protein
MMEPSSPVAIQSDLPDIHFHSSPSQMSINSLSLIIEVVVEDVN